MDVTRKQAERFGTEIVVDTVVDVDVAKRPFTLTLESAGRITADAVIVASGASAKYLGLESEKKLLGYGVSACATCDGFFFRGKEVVVVGGGDTAMEEATFLTKFCTKVYLVHRRSEFRASKIMVQRALANPKIEVLLDTVVEEILGEPATGVKGVRVKNTKTGDVRTLAVSGYFAAIGHQPNTELFKGKLDMNEVGYLKIAHPTTKTSVDGHLRGRRRRGLHLPSGGLGRRRRLQGRDRRRALARRARHPLTAELALRTPDPTRTRGATRSARAGPGGATRATSIRRRLFLLARVIPILRPTPASASFQNPSGSPEDQPTSPKAASPNETSWRISGTARTRASTFPTRRRFPSTA